MNFKKYLFFKISSTNRDNRCKIVTNEFTKNFISYRKRKVTLAVTLGHLCAKPRFLLMLLLNWFIFLQKKHLITKRNHAAQLLLVNIIIHPWIYINRPRQSVCHNIFLTRNMFNIKLKLRQKLKPSSLTAWQPCLSLQILKWSVISKH